jgi:Thioredoxin like C-terminal domain
VQPPSGPGSTPESYLGFERAARFVPAEPRYGVHAFTGPGRRLPLHHLAYAGTWSIGGQAVTAVRDASLELHFRAKKVYLVLSSAGDAPRTLGLDLDGRPLPAVTVQRQQLYTLVSLPRMGSHQLRLRFPPGLSGFAFTFG